MHLDQTLTAGIRQGPQVHAVDHREDSGVRTDAQRERQHRHQGEAGAAREGAQGVTQVLEEAGKHVDSFHRSW